MKGDLRPARLAVTDVVSLGASGLRSRPVRALLSALGIAVGIAAMVAVAGISASGTAQLDRMLDRLGTNLLTVSPGKTMNGEDATLPTESIAMIDRIGPVELVAATGVVEANVYRTDAMPPARTSSVTVLAAGDDLLATAGASVASGAWLNTATGQLPTVVLGAVAARRLDVHTVGQRLWLGGQWFSLMGILDPVPLVPDLDAAALVGWAAAQRFLRFDGHPTTIYLRAAEGRVHALQAVLGATANPAAPSLVAVSRPSDALAAKLASESTLGGLLLGLGAVALLVGGIGVANTMVISVLERRGEIGLRRSLGATRGQIRIQFLTESLVLSALGGLGGTTLGIAVTWEYAALRDWPVVVPGWATGGGLSATLVVGTLAGIYPALRASRLSPTEALATP